MLKRFFDIFASLIALFLFLPVMLVVIVILAADGGSVIFKQVRVGLNGKEFYIYKFRSMVLNADKLGSYSTTTDDIRITKVGRVIRKTSIDELPQLLNVLFGDMSLVGPRPNVPIQKSEYSEEQWAVRNSVLPGITGLAQATKRSDASWQERFALDIEYVSKISFLLDLKIIILTLKQIISSGGN